MTAKRVLFVAWQAPDSRAITPVGRLRVTRAAAGHEYEFCYLRPARNVLGRPFASFPNFDVVYRSTELFPFFENRMVPRQSPDFAGMAASVGLRSDADPFEVLAISGGQRATDTLEVFPEPRTDRAASSASFRFLVRGARYRPGAHDQIDRLQVGDHLRLEPEADNPVDPQAVLVVPASGTAVGWAPAYLCPALHRSASAATHGWDDLDATVSHIGDRSGPAHFRLLCEVSFPWPFPDGPFDTPEFEVF